MVQWVLLKILLFIYGYLVEKVCGAFWFLIGERKVLIGGCKEEGKKRKGEKNNKANVPQY